MAIGAQRVHEPDLRQGLCQLVRHHFRHNGRAGVRDQSRQPAHPDPVSRDFDPRGTIGQYVLPSAGPIFYELVGFGPRFHELVATNDPTYSGFAKYLWRHFSTGSADIGTGISAMPSMHVSMSVWTVIAARAIWKPLMIPAILYALTVWLGSIASGWHYATDGIVGAAIVLSLHHVLVKRPAKRREAALQAQPEVVASPA
ncbi:phosphatase PAP2 family protein [Sphingomonas lutea]|uniref:Phosphatase PAP2 family protein n=1 Tax=Sphingomonas lutea TaxID=1045317 RepID=A0A7G9SJJ0_9SPHN|nr:phosphatase PAP2 family protein [Sphingomonas lutea]QNN68015.1 phosphatase PAP2 family protein [Sphingomonas lutea]